MNMKEMKCSSVNRVWYKHSNGFIKVFECMSGVTKGHYERFKGILTLE